MITIKSPAKINLFLYVTSKRNDGYHELFTLMTFINLYDEINLKFGGNKIYVSCKDFDIPEDESNLAYKAAFLFFKRLSTIKTPFKSNNGIRIKIKKKIPVGAGLGGGSSNAAFILKALNKYYGSPFSLSELMEMGLCIGSDVPFFIHGSPAIVQGIGERIKAFAPLMTYHVILAFPGINTSTSKVFKNFDLRLTKKSKFNNILLNIGNTNPNFDIKNFLHNDLEIAACKIYSDIRLVKKEMSQILSREVFMTGSGSSFFVLFSDYKKAKQNFQKLSNKWKGTCKSIFFTSFACG